MYSIIYILIILYSITHLKEIFNFFIRIKLIEKGKNYSNKDKGGSRTVRTDLAVEIKTDISDKDSGIEKEEAVNGDIKTTIIRITSKKGEEILGRPCGTYITAEFPDIDKIADFGGIKEEIIKALSSLLNGISGTVLVAGLGNTEITPDSVGPFTAKKILATRHISGQLAKSPMCSVKRELKRRSL